MDVDELMALKRPLTDAERAFMEEEVLKLANELRVEVEELTRNLDPADPVVARLHASVANLGSNIEKASALRVEEAAAETRQLRRRRMRVLREQQAVVEYSWERLPVYAWNNEFARAIGRLLAQVPKRLHSYLHNLAAQATLISNCIAMAHRDHAPTQIVTADELRAWRTVAHHATFNAESLLDEMAENTKQQWPEIALIRMLLEKIRGHFQLADQETREKRPGVVH